jgi:hypothetical protein
MATTSPDPFMRGTQSQGEQFEVVTPPKIGQPEIVEAAPEDHPTESHELANADHEEKGAAQLGHRQTEVRDLGWNDEPPDVPSPLVGGLPNEELWTLIRRFNKVCDPGYILGEEIRADCKSSKCTM